MPTALYTGAALKTVANPSVATSFVPTGNASDSLTIPPGATNAIRYWLHFAGVLHVGASGPGDFTMAAKIGSVTIMNIQNVPFAGSAENNIVVDLFFTVLPNSTIIRRSTLLMGGDGADLLDAYDTDSPKTATAAISSATLTATIILNTGLDPAVLLTVTDFQLQQMNA